MADGSDAVPPDLFGKRFFSRSPLRSGLFLTATLFFVGVLLGSALFFLAYRRLLSSNMMILLFIVVCIRALNSMSGAILRHRRIRQAYFTREVSNFPSGEGIDVALDVAARAILDDLFYTCLTLLAFLAVLVMLLSHAR